MSRVPAQIPGWQYTTLFFSCWDIQHLIQAWDSVSITQLLLIETFQNMAGVCNHIVIWEDCALWFWSVIKTIMTDCNHVPVYSHTCRAMLMTRLTVQIIEGYTSPLQTSIGSVQGPHILQTIVSIWRWASAHTYCMFKYAAHVQNYALA